MPPDSELLSEQLIKTLTPTKSTSPNLFLNMVLTNKSSRSAKMIPKAILHDKEHLYDELQKCKKIIKDQQIELRQLKTTNKFFMEEIQTLNQKITLIGTEEFDSLKNKCDNIEFQSLRKQIRDLQKSLELKEREVMYLSNSLSLEKVRENDKQKKQLVLEAMKSASYENVILNTLQQDNIELTSTVRHLEKQLNDTLMQYQENEATWQRKYQQSLHQLRLSRRLYKTKDEELITLLNRDKVHQEILHRKNPTEAQLKKQLNLTEFEYKKVSIQLGESLRRINDLERRLQTLMKESKDAQDRHEKEVYSLKESLDNFTRDENIRRQEPKMRLSRVPTTIQSSTGVRNKISQNNEDPMLKAGIHDLSKTVTKQLISPDYPIDEHNDEDALSIGKELVIETNRRDQEYKEHFENTMHVLKYKLRSLNITINELEAYIFQPKNIFEGWITYDEVQYQLTCYPFSIQDDSVLTAVCNYIFDVDDELGDVSSKNERIERVRSIFRTLLSNYTILSPKQQKGIEKEIFRSFRHHYGSLKDYLNRKSNRRLQHLQSSQYLVSELFEAIKVYDLPFTMIHLDHIMQIIYEISPDKEIDYFDWEQFYGYLEHQCSDIITPSSPFVDYNNQGLLEKEEDEVGNPFAEVLQIPEIEPNQEPVDIKYVDSVHNSYI